MSTTVTTPTPTPPPPPPSIMSTCNKACPPQSPPHLRLRSCLLVTRPVHHYPTPHPIPTPAAKPEPWTATIPTGPAGICQEELQDPCNVGSISITRTRKSLISCTLCTVPRAACLLHWVLPGPSRSLQSRPYVNEQTGRQCLIDLLH